MQVLDAEYWNNRFLNHDTPWDAGQVSTPLKEYIDQLSNKSISILLPGCGNAHEAEYLLQKGFTHITVIDLAETVTGKLKEKFKADDGFRLHIIKGNFFALQQSFDLILEQTFLCALHPSLRKKYAHHCKEILSSNGKIAGVLFNRKFAAEGPPFGGCIDEYLKLFNPCFNIKTLESCYNSIPPRAGAECFLIAVKK